MAVMGGRKTKLTPETQDAICKALADGNTRLDAAVHGGVTYNAFRMWFNAGKESEDEPFYSFYLAVKEAESRAIVDAIATIKKAAAERDEVIVKETSEAREVKNADGSTRWETVVVKRETVTRRVFDWRAAAWISERRRPEWFGLRETALLAALEKRLRELESERKK